MALLKALALGAIAAISVPYVLRDADGPLRQMAHYGTVHPDAGTFAFAFSFPIFVAVALFALVMFRASAESTR